MWLLTSGFDSDIANQSQEASQGSPKTPARVAGLLFASSYLGAGISSAWLSAAQRVTFGRGVRSVGRANAHTISSQGLTRW